jgi:hypothetical protein
MTLQKLLTLIKHPKLAYAEALSRAPTKESIYIACEVYDGETKDYKLIFINTISELTEFIPVLHLSEIAVLDEKQTLINTDDYTEVYDYLNKFRNLKYFTSEVLEDLVGDYGFVNVLNTGHVNNFFDISIDSINFIRNNSIPMDYDELMDLGVNMAEFHILQSYLKKYTNIPSENPEEFMEYMSTFNT